MQYDLNGEKVLLLINVQKYKKQENFNSAPIDVENIEKTFKERVLLDFVITERRLRRKKLRNRVDSKFCFKTIDQANILIRSFLRVTAVITG